MPTLLIEKGFRFSFFLSEPKYKAPHIHVDKGEGEEAAIFWLNPVHLQKSKRFKSKELAEIEKIILKHRTYFLGEIQ